MACVAYDDAHNIGEHNRGSPLAPLGTERAECVRDSLGNTSIESGSCLVSSSTQLTASVELLGRSENLAGD